MFISKLIHTNLVNFLKRTNYFPPTTRVSLQSTYPLYEKHVQIVVGGRNIVVHKTVFFKTGLMHRFDFELIEWH